MADRFYGIAVGGQRPKDVTEASSTTSKAIELRISDTAYAAGRQAIANALRALDEYLRHKETNPIA